MLFMRDLAVAHHRAGRLADALPLLEESLQRQRKTWGDQNPDTMETMRLLAMLHMDRQDYPALVRLYDAWGKPAEAEKWFAKLPAEQKVRVGLQRQNAWPILWGWPRF
jgi:hypothetical protein